MKPPLPMCSYVCSYVRSAAKRQTESVTLQLDKKVELALFDKRLGALDTGLSNQVAW